MYISRVTMERFPERPTHGSIQPCRLSSPASCRGQVVVRDLNYLSGCFNAENTALESNSIVEIIAARSAVRFGGWLRWLRDTESGEDRAKEVNPDLEKSDWIGQSSAG
jgi:hypothetical protein